jgi:hypothetical protein
MSSINYGRMVKALDNLTPHELENLRWEINSRLGIKMPHTVEASSPYGRGYLDGWNNCVREYHETHAIFLQRLNNHYFTLGCAINYAHGIATAGFGNITQETLKELGGQIANAATQLEFEVSRYEATYQTDVGLDLTFAIENKDALKAMYDGTDPEGSELRAIAAREGKIKRQNIIDIRPMFTPGAKSGARQWRKWLRQEWLDYETQHPEATPAQVKAHLLGKYATWDKAIGKHRLKADAPAEAGQAVKSLTGKSAEDVAHYRRDLLNKE